jgi:hypothetical protein
MDYIDIWNEFCFALNKCKSTNASESDFQREVVSMLGQLGWSNYKGEIVQRRPLPIGANNSLSPDIVIKHENKDILVFELKRPSLDDSERRRAQLYSYMLHLKLQYGIFIGSTMQIYYDKPDGKKPVLIANFTPSESNEEAITFLKLISKSNFDEQALQAYCERKLVEQEEKARDQKMVDELKSTPMSEWEGQIKALLYTSISTKHNEAIAKRIMDELTISVRKKEKQKVERSEVIRSTHNSDTKSKGRDYSKYTINGSDPLGKSALALRIVQLIVEQNPNLTYDDLLSIFPKGLHPSRETITKIEDVSENEKKHRRYHMKDPLNSADGIRFVVSTQWSSESIDKMKRVAEEQGLHVAVYS